MPEKAHKDHSTSVVLSIEISEENQEVMLDIANELVERAFEVVGKVSDKRINFTGSAKNLQLNFGEHCINGEGEIPESLSKIAEMQDLTMSISRLTLPDDYKPELTAAPNAP